MPSAAEMLFAGPLAGPFRHFVDGRLDAHGGTDRQELLRGLNDFLALRHAYRIDFASQLERFRNHLEGTAGDRLAVQPHITFSLKAQRLQFVDPNNGTFALQCETSVGVPLDDALAFLVGGGITLDEKAFMSLVSLGGVVWLDDERLTQRLASLLRVRVQGGEVEHSGEYYRFGNVSRHIWLIQTFTLRTPQDADFRNLPFDRFTFVVDFAVGLGGDVANVQVIVDPVHKDLTTLFSAAFSCGEFRTDGGTARLEPIGFLEDPTCYFENRVRLHFGVRRDPLPILLRIVLPLLLMVSMLIAGSCVIRDQAAMATQMIPALFLAMVALQLIVTQGMPRGAPFSRLDGLFALSYTLAILLFFVYLLPAGAFSGGLVLGAAALYLVGCIIWLSRPRAR